MRERYVVKPEGDQFTVVDTDTSKLASYADWSEGDGFTAARVTHFEKEEYARQVADYRNAHEEYTVESERALGDDYTDFSQPVNGFVEVGSGAAGQPQSGQYPYDGQPVCFRCLVEWVGVGGEEILNYQRYEGEPQYLCVNDCGGGKVRKWSYE